MTVRARSMSVEVDDDAGGATVVLRFADGELRASCSCGRAGCAHLEAAIAAAAATSTLAASSGPASVAPVSLASPREAASLRPDPAAGALRTLLEALLRAAAGEVTAAVDEALRSASAQVAERSLAGASRVLGRITASLVRGSARESALAIAALGETVAALEGARSDAERAEAGGVAIEEARLEELELVELARARERGVVRWERRLLVDPQSGALYREEGAARSASLSGGVAGRRLVVSLASRLVSREPSRITLLQYALEPAAPSATLARAAAVASRSVALPSDVVASPLVSVASPRLVWLAPARVDFAGGRATLTDEDGASLELDRDAGAEALRDRIASGATVRALAGALCADVDGFRLEAWSAVVDAARGPELVALAF